MLAHPKTVRSQPFPRKQAKIVREDEHSLNFRTGLCVQPDMKRILLAALVCVGFLQTVYSQESDITRTVNVVQVHVGKSDSARDNFIYTPPTGYRIVRYKLNERSRGGDANYRVTESTESKIVVRWHAKSKEVKILGATVNTITAFLQLDMTVHLELIPVAPVPPEQWPKIVSVTSGVVFLVAILVIALFIPYPSPFRFFVFRLILASAAAGFGASLPGLLRLEITSIPGIIVNAGGAIGLFVLIYLINPARLAATPPRICHSSTHWKRSVSWRPISRDATRRQSHF